MNEEEKKIVEHLKKTSKDRTIIPLDDEILIAVNLIEKLQKENEELKNLMAHKNGYTKKLEQDLFENARNYVIPIQEVKDKIEELNQYYKKEIYPSLYQWADITITEHYDEMIELLQGLLEEGENNG